MADERYRMKYVNCEVSAIHDDYEHEELCAEEITDRLNKQDKKIKELNEEVELLQECNEQLSGSISRTREIVENGGVVLTKEQLKTCIEYPKAVDDTVCHAKVLRLINKKIDEIPKCIVVSPRHKTVGQMKNMYRDGYCKGLMELKKELEKT